jgi:hypothetical protein
VPEGAAAGGEAQDGGALPPAAYRSPLALGPEWDLVKAVLHSRHTPAGLCVPAMAISLLQCLYIPGVWSVTAVQAEEGGVPGRIRDFEMGTAQALLYRAREGAGSCGRAVTSTTGAAPS